jgi:hypothetical protein
MLVRVLKRKDVWMVLGFLDIEIRRRFILKLFVVNNFDVRIRFFYLCHEHLNLPFRGRSLDQKDLVDIPVIGHEVLIDEALINWVGGVVRLLEVVIERRPDDCSHLWQKFEYRARTLHLNDDFVVISSILLSVHLSDMESLDVVELNLGDVGHVHDGGSLLLGRLKLLGGPLSESLLLPFELLVSSLLVVMKNIIHEAEFDLDFVKLDVVILHHSVLLFQVKNILAEQLEEDLFAQNIIVLPD